MSMHKAFTVARKASAAAVVAAAAAVTESTPGGVTTVEWVVVAVAAVVAYVTVYWTSNADAAPSARTGRARHIDSTQTTTLGGGN